jgi:hypothetical protein
MRISPHLDVYLRRGIQNSKSGIPSPYNFPQMQSFLSSETYLFRNNSEECILMINNYESNRSVCAKAWMLKPAARYFPLRVSCQHHHHIFFLMTGCLKGCYFIIYPDWFAANG